MQQRLQPIERPKRLMMKLVYALSKKQYGKVLSPLSQVSSRMPLPFLFWSGKINKLEKHLMLDKGLVLLLRVRVAQLNTCSFCLDMSKSFAVKDFGNDPKFYNTADFETSPLYSDKEKAALRFATEFTVHHKISDDTYSHTASLFTERELTEITWVTATEHVYNFANIAFNIESDGLCAVQPVKATAHS